MIEKLQTDWCHLRPRLWNRPTLGVVTVASLIVALISAACGSDSHLEVGGGGGFATINEAIEAAERGEAILIHAGTYTEEVEVTKPVKLDDYGDGPVWIDGECSRPFNILVEGSGSGSISGI